MKGRQILIEPLPAGGHAAALMLDGRLQDLLVDPGPADATPRPEAIYRAVPARPMKGLGGVMVDLGGGRRLPARPAPARPRPPAAGAGRRLGRARQGAAGQRPPAPQGPHRDPDPRRAGRQHRPLACATATAATPSPRSPPRRWPAPSPTLGLILRSAAATAPDAEIRAEIAALRAEWAALLRARPPARPPACAPAPGAAAEALRDWREGGESLREAATALADAGVWEEVDALRRPMVALGEGSMAIEPTRALVAVDVNTGGDLSTAAALKANLAAAAELPRQLRLRGLGGQVTIDFAPLPRADRPRVEQALAAALRARRHRHHDRRLDPARPSRAAAQTRPPPTLTPPAKESGRELAFPTACAYRLTCSGAPAGA